MNTADRRHGGIQIHQSLHGYENGHRLVASSIRLPLEARRTMLLLSDMSGPSMIRGFETYLTGYPLQELGSYVFARTWYAPEMERPGCVWTHSLLIGYPELVQIGSLAELQPLFVRPEPGRGNSSYADVFVFDPSLGPATSGQAAAPAAEPMASELVQALYGAPDRPVLITVGAPEQLEDLVFRVWAQQWPRLRRSFTFCTGALAPRTLSGQSFDLQLIAHASQRTFERDLPSGLFIRGQDPRVDPPLEWVAIATHDLLRNTSSALRDFLWSYGADIDQERAAFRPLVETFQAIRSVEQGTRTVTELIEATARAFPSATAATWLKAGLVSESGRSRSLLRSVPRHDVLLELSRTEFYQAFATDRVVAQLHIDPTDPTGRSLLSSLLVSELNPFGRRVLAASLQPLTVEEALRCARGGQRALERVLSIRDDLAKSPALWQESTDLQRRSFSVLAQRFGAEQDRWEAVLQAMLDARSDAVADDVVTHLDSVAAEAVFRWLNEDEIRRVENLPRGWERALAQRPELILSWLARTPAPTKTSLVLITRLLSPHLPELHRMGAERWLPLAEEFPRGLNATSEIRARAFLLALGFHNPGGGASLLVVHTFQIVHDAAARGDLGDSWALIERHIPSGGSWLWGDWDRCEKLRRALLDRFIRFQWPTAHFLASVQRQDTFQQVVTYGETFSSGRAFLRRVRRDVEAGAQATSTQRAVLFELNK